MEEVNERNEARKFYTIARGSKAGFQPRTSIGKDSDNNLIGKDRLKMERWRRYFHETLNIKNDVEIREEIIYQGPEGQIEPNTRDEAWEIIRTLTNNNSPGEDNISAELIKNGEKIMGRSSCTNR
jgi:hypothetical protein